MDRTYEQLINLRCPTLLMFNGIEMIFSLKSTFVKIVNMISGRKNSYPDYLHYLLKELK
ncbi:hypothetical protein LINPERPRIM_LOCUS20961 [Linum perenne]